MGSVESPHFGLLIRDRAIRTGQQDTRGLAARCRIPDPSGVNMTRVLRRLAPILLAACSTSTESVKPLTVSLAASASTVAVGDTVALVASAGGTNLVGMVIDFGDSVGDSYATSGASSARVTFRHAYSARGTYTARVVVTDAAASQQEASVEVKVN